MLFNTRTFLFIAQTFLEFLIFSFIVQNIVYNNTAVHHQGLRREKKSYNNQLQYLWFTYPWSTTLLKDTSFHRKDSREQERHFRLVCHIYQPEKKTKAKKEEKDGKCLVQRIPKMMKKKKANFVHAESPEKFLKK